MHLDPQRRGVYATPVTVRDPSMTDRRNGLTYAESGVDIDAGEALVERLKPLARSTRRTGADAAPPP